MIHLRTAGQGSFLPLLFIPPRPERRAEGPKSGELCPLAWGPGPAHQEGEERPLTGRQAAKSPVAVISSDSELSTESELGKASNKPRRRSGPTRNAHPGVSAHREGPGPRFSSPVSSRHRPPQAPVGRTPQLSRRLLRPQTADSGDLGPERPPGKLPRPGDPRRGLPTNTCAPLPGPCS